MSGNSHQRRVDRRKMRRQLFLSSARGGGYFVHHLSGGVIGATVGGIEVPGGSRFGTMSDHEHSAVHHINQQVKHYPWQVGYRPDDVVPGIQGSGKTVDGEVPPSCRGNATK